MLHNPKLLCGQPRRLLRKRYLRNMKRQPVIAKPRGNMRKPAYFG
jgi:hypothetical protein